jgi:hypothetical protein
MDTNSVDVQGRIILDLCKALNLRILNGRTPGDRWGNLTRFPTRANEKPSSLDYGICTINLLTSIQNFIVFPISELSDHCCISISIDTSRHTMPHHSPPLTGPPKMPRLKIEAEGVVKYKQNLGRSLPMQKNHSGRDPQTREGERTYINQHAGLTMHAHWRRGDTKKPR